MERINITCRLPAENVHFLDSLGEALDRDRSYLINQAIDDYIASQRWQLEEIDAAIAEADAGKFATDKQVKAAFAELRS
jgi:predicted transcriptional regulator